MWLNISIILGSLFICAGLDKVGEGIEKKK